MIHYEILVALEAHMLCKETAQTENYAETEYLTYMLEIMWLVICDSYCRLLYVILTY